MVDQGSRCLCVDTDIPAMYVRETACQVLNGPNFDHAEESTDDINVIDRHSLCILQDENLPRSSSIHIIHLVMPLVIAHLGVPNGNRAAGTPARENAHFN